jgi:hypothetical protein
MKKVCRVCRERPVGVRPQVLVTARNLAHEWVLEVCRDCWRVFEAMLDEGAAGQQIGLNDGKRAGSMWFL